MDGDVSSFLLELHRASRRMPHERFRPWAFSQLASVVHFDSAFWYRWAIDSTTPPLRASYLYKQPQALLEEYFSTEMWKDDVVYQRALASPPGTAVFDSRLNFPSARMREFMLRHQQEHLLAIGYWDTISMVAAGVSLYRDASGDAFSHREVVTIEAVASHFVDAWRENWLMEVVRQSSSRADLPKFGLAVVMSDGLLSEAQDNFGELMRLEWPSWQGPKPPQELLGYFATQPSAWVGRAVAVYQRLLADGTMLLLVRRAHPLDHLAPRKRSVAMLVAKGASQSEIAKQLSLSPSTVNNYLAEVYERLDLHDKVMLANLVTTLEP